MATTVLPGPDLRPSSKEISETVREYAATRAQGHVENHWHRIYHAVSLLLLFGLLAFAWSGWTRPVERIYVAQHANGRAEVVPGVAFTYQREEHSLKYFLTQFVQLHYGRRKATVTSELSRSLYYLDGPIALKVKREWENPDMMKKISSDGYDYEVKVQQVVLRQTQIKPYEAEVDYVVEKTDASSRQVMESKNYTASIQYVIVEEIPNEIVVHNPIGLKITHLRSDEAFRKE